MMLSTSGYTVGNNRPMNCARILWKPIAGTVTAGGTGGALAANDYTNQRWAAPSGVASWLLTTSAMVAVDTFFIAAHNLAGQTIRAWMAGASRTNLATWSEDFTNGAWIKQGVTASANAGISPDGLLTAEKIIPSVVNDGKQLARSFSVTSGQAYTFSYYVKADGYNFCGILFALAGFGTNTVDVFDLSAGSVSVNQSGTAAIANIGGGWYRVSTTRTATATASSTFQMRVQNTNAAGNSFPGDGTSGLLMWGAQLEAATSESSYIKTEASTVTSTKQFISPWITPPDNTTIAIMTNNAGLPWLSTQFGIEVSEGAGVQIGIIRAGVALQMQRPVYGGVKPIGLSRKVETRHTITEAGQWAGRTIQRVALETAMDWPYLSADWYRDNFEPFSQALPQTPFGLIQNPQQMPESVAWCWTDDVPEPENMGILDYMQVSLSITGYAG